MKKIKKIAVCMSLLAILLSAGCVCGPRSYYSGCYTNSLSFAPGSVSGCDIGCETDCGGGCEPCGPMDCGLIEYGGGSCLPCMPSRGLNCRTSFSNIGGGLCVLGRGVLDVAAAPFVVVGNVLSSGCRYNVSVDCGEMYCENPCETVGACNACGASAGSGCTNCSGGFSEGIEYNTNPAAENSSAAHRPAIPAPHRHSISQAVYQQPKNVAVKFVQPK